MYFSNLNSIMELHSDMCTRQTTTENAFAMFGLSDLHKVFAIYGNRLFRSVCVSVRCHLFCARNSPDHDRWAVTMSGESSLTSSAQPQTGAGEKEEQKSEKIKKKQKNVVNVHSPASCRNAQCRRKGEQRWENKQNIARNNWNCVYWKKAIISIYSSAAVVSFAHSLSLPIGSFTWCSHCSLAEY